MNYILVDGEPVAEPDILKWAQWYETHRFDWHLSDALAESVQVSTAFLSLDHNFGASGKPVLWESMVFGGELAGECERYTSQADAIAGHAAMCQRVRDALPRPKDGGRNPFGGN